MDHFQIETTSSYGVRSLPPQIIYRQYQIFSALCRFKVAGGQSLHVAVSRSPSYLKEVTISSGFSYAWNSVSAPFRASSSVSPCLFLSSSRSQIAIVRWRCFIAVHITNISWAGQWGLGRLPSSRITIVYFMWRCMKLIRSLLHVDKLPPHPSTGHYTDLVAQGKETLYNLGYGGGRGGIPLRVPNFPIIGLAT